jgi:hypothetical protein
MLTRRLLPAAALFSLLPFLGGWSGKPHILPKDGYAPTTNAPGQPNLVYYGGPVLSSVEVVVVYWGTNVNYQEQIPGFYQSVTNSPYFDWLAEYNTPSQKIARGSFVRAVVDKDAPTQVNLADQDVQNELSRLMDAGTLPPPDANTLYAVYFPPGVNITLPDGTQSCRQFCAYHSGFGVSHGTGSVFYSVIPDMGGGCSQGCGQSDQFGDECSASSHEMIEAVTDPDPSNGAWYDNANGEIGDICNGSDGNIGSFVVQQEWSNKNGGCITSDPSAIMTCGAGQSPCGGGCADTSTDPANCGVCGTACGAGQACTGGACVTISTCPSGQTVCGHACTDTTTDVANCGTCGAACGQDEGCSAGVCTTVGVKCAAGQTSCNNTCADLTSDPNNCGSCGNACAFGQTCGSGTCMGMAFNTVPLGGTCTAPSDCQSNQCTPVGSQTVCTQSCSPGDATTCPSGFVCDAQGGNDVCVAQSLASAAGGSGGCSATPGDVGDAGDGSALLCALAMLAALLPFAFASRARRRVRTRV